MLALVTVSLAGKSMLPSSRLRNAVPSRISMSASVSSLANVVTLAAPAKGAKIINATRNNGALKFRFSCVMDSPALRPMFLLPKIASHSCLPPQAIGQACATNSFTIDPLGTLAVLHTMMHPPFHCGVRSFPIVA